MSEAIHRAIAAFTGLRVAILEHEGAVAHLAGIPRRRCPYNHIQHENVHDWQQGWDKSMGAAR